MFENAISKKEIAKIKKSSSKFSEAKTLKEDGLTKEDVDLSFRDSSVSFSNDAWIYTLLFPFIEEANENSGWKYEIDSCEPVQIAKYGKDQHYSWHQDGAQNEFRRCNNFSILSVASQYTGDKGNKAVIGNVVLRPTV